MNKSSTQKPSIIKSIISVVARYHLTIFIVIVVTGLSSAVIILNTILTQSSDPTDYTSSLDTTNFDQTTIDRVSRLKTSGEAPADITLPAGRISPFAE